MYQYGTDWVLRVVITGIALGLIWIGCTKQQANNVVNAADVACVVIENFADSNSTESKICATEEELSHYIHDILAARKAKAAGQDGGVMDAGVKVDGG